MHSQMTCAGWLFIRVSASLGVFLVVFSTLIYCLILHGWFGSHHDHGLRIRRASRQLSSTFAPLARVFTHCICPHTLDLKHTYSAAARVCLYRLVCSRVYSLSTLNLFIVCSFVQFYPIVVSAWTKITCAFFYCRISVPGGVRTRDTAIFQSFRVSKNLLSV